MDSLHALKKRLVRCGDTDCPFRSTEPGYYPKPPRGPSDARIALLFQNPGSPVGKNLHGAECGSSINDVDLEAAVQLAIQGRRNWLFNTSSLNETVWQKHNIVEGQTVYSTDLVKCANPPTSEQFNRRLVDRCSRRYLDVEFKLLNPTVIIAFGVPAKAWLERRHGVRWGGALKALPMEKRVKPVGDLLLAVMPHPSGLWRYPSMSQDEFSRHMDFVFASARAHAGETVTSTD